MKRKKDLTLNLLCMICYGLCAATWLYKAFTGGRGFDGIIGFVWLAGAVIWTVRTVRALRAGTGEQEDAP
nr:hypothetical protein [uncultured Oscillibacter sp.]